ncbi:MAG: DUF4835 family protein [Flavobacteriaceae bacterium]|jgi:hypothetical protein|nr:DUF4835 family protein [Flavobacteriaceae bacterium]MBT6169682.1 DUF4835 family protein [Flavobacteriaceae bacterium]
MNRILFFVLILFINITYTQEIDSKVIVNSDQINQTSKAIFLNLEKSITTFINSKSWSDNNYLIHEKIDLNILITVLSYSNNKFKANFEFQSLRPVLNSTYQTPLFNFVDKNVEFEYEEFETLFFVENKFQSDLVSLLSYYINIIYGIDSDSFINNSGNIFYSKAQEILNLANQSGFSNTWQSVNSGGRINKFWLIENLNSSNSKEFRDLLYNYHVNGLDLMHKDKLLSKKNISSSIISLERMNRRIPNSILLKIFFETKSDEIKDIFSSGPDLDTVNLYNQLNRMAPFFSNKWNNLR